MRRSLPLWAVLFVFQPVAWHALSACTHDQALIVTGESLDALGQQFAELGPAMNEARQAGTISADTYAGWRAFGRKFQATYPLACNLWRAADAAKDDRLQVQAGAIVAALGVDLATWVALLEHAPPPAPDGGP